MPRKNAKDKRVGRKVGSPRIGVNVGSPKVKWKSDKSQIIRIKEAIEKMKKKK